MAAASWPGRALHTWPGPNYPDYRFKGTQLNSFTDSAYFRAVGKNSLLIGANAFYDRFAKTFLHPTPWTAAKHARRSAHFYRTR
jgi:hypothetical protein